MQKSLYGKLPAGNVFGLPHMNTLLNSFVIFFRMQSASALVLLLAAILALFAANSPFRMAYEHFWQTLFTLGVGPLSLSGSLRFWVNEGLMAIFFFVVGLEIRREFSGGELAGQRQAALPLFAALGGMLFPALLYMAIAGFGTGDALRGWGIPTVTDIAFSLGALALLGNRVPQSLKIFLSALAIADDVGAIALIALFYSHHPNASWLMVALGLLLALGLLNRLGIRNLMIYLPGGLLLWLAVLNAGIHPTLAGVLLAMVLPAAPRLTPIPAISPPALSRSNDPETDPEQEGTLQRLEAWLHPWVAYGVLPLFAFGNAGVSLPGLQTNSTWWSNSVFLGVFFGLLAGKPLGITLFSRLAIRFGLAAPLRDIGMHVIPGVAFLGGIGFTMSLFIAVLAFQSPEDIVYAKMGILLASLLSGLAGLATLRTLLPRDA